MGWTGHGARELIFLFAIPKVFRVQLMMSCLVCVRMLFPSPTIRIGNRPSERVCSSAEKMRSRRSAPAPGTAS